MGTLLDKPITEKETHTDAANGYRYGVSAMQGWRVEMEDAHIAKGSIEGLEDHGFFAVFDGHGGKEAALLSARDMMQKVREMPEYREYCSAPSSDHALLGRAMTNAFLSIDVDLREQLWESDKLERPDHSGCTAIAAIVTPTHIVVANCGDSRSALAVASEDIAVPMSEDHKPNNPEEMERIHNAGGTVSMKRVDGDLAVSRALGDFQYKDRPDLKPEQQKVSPEPECRVHVRNLASDQALIIACDGIWDVMSNEQCCTYVAELIKTTGETDAGLICEELLDECLRKGSRDNMSAIVVAFPKAFEAVGTGGVAALRQRREAEEAKRAAEEQADEGAYDARPEAS